MAELSYLWEGTTTGDASQAAYCQDLFNQWLTLPLSIPDVPDASDVAGVIPGYLHDLRPMASGSGEYSSVVVLPGAALIRNWVYINTETLSFPVQPLVNSNTVRFDYIVAQVDTDTQTVRLQYIMGTERTVAAIPRLTTEYSEQQVPICLIYVNSSAYTIADETVVDLRKFIPTHQHPYSKNANNLVRNSEFMARSLDNVGGVVVPDGWETVGTFSGIYASTRQHPQIRGYTTRCVITSGNVSTAVLRQKIAVAQNVQTFSINAIVFGIEYTLGQNINALRIRGVRETGEYTSTSGVCAIIPGWMYQTARTTVTFEETDIEYLEVDAYGFLPDDTQGCVFELGSILVSEGYFTGPFRPIHETIMLVQDIGDAAWNSTAKSSATTTVSFATSFIPVVLPMVPPYSAAAILLVTCRDSGSAASVNCGVAILDINNVTCGTVFCAGLAANRWISKQILVPVDVNIAAATVHVPQFKVVATATGASTLDVTIKLVGLVT